MKKPRPKRTMREGQAVTRLIALSIRMKSTMTYIYTCTHVGPQGQDRFVSTGRIDSSVRADRCAGRARTHKYVSLSTTILERFVEYNDIGAI